MQEFLTFVVNRIYLGIGNARFFCLVLRNVNRGGMLVCFDAIAKGFLASSVFCDV